MIYISRSIILGWYFILPPTPATTLVFAALMGFLWLGVGPLVAGSVVEMFGLRWQAMILGLAFMSHQLGSFLGAFGGGLLFDALGSYDLAWRLGVGMGLMAGIVQVTKSLAATYCINNGIPNDGNAEGDDEGCTGSKRHCGEMQGEQSQAKSGKSRNGVRQHGCRGRTANAAMQNEHNAGVDDREHSKHAASRRANLKA